jgi:hypothetical protein
MLVHSRHCHESGILQQIHHQPQFCRAWLVSNALVDGAQVGNVAVGVEDFGTSVAAHEVTTVHADSAPIVVGVGVVLGVHVRVFRERFRWDRKHGQSLVGAR